MWVCVQPNDPHRLGGQGRGRPAGVWLALLARHAAIAEVHTESPGVAPPAVGGDPDAGLYPKSNCGRRDAGPP